MGKLCTHCETEVLQKYCPNCGKPAELQRIDRKYILHELAGVLNFEKGILLTIKELLIRPGQNIRDFIHQDRNRLVKPVIFLIVCSLAYTLAQQFLRFEDGYVNAGGFGESKAALIFEWIQQNYGYANVLMAIFIAFWLRVFFRKYNYNFFENIILLCFVIGIGMLIYTFFGIVESLTALKVLHIGGIIGMIYASWAIGQFFDKKRKMNYIKGFLAYLFGMITFFVGAPLVGFGIDWILKML